jgi:hypothetical protein
MSLNSIWSAVGNHKTDIINNFIIISGWLIAFIFAIRQQRSSLKDATRLEIYKELWPYQNEILRVGQDFVSTCSVFERLIRTLDESKLRAFIIEKRMNIAASTDAYAEKIKQLRNLHDQWVDIIEVTGWTDLMKGALENVTELGVDMINDFGTLLQNTTVAHQNILSLNLVSYQERAKYAFENFSCISDSYFREVKKQLLKPIL